MYTPLYLHEQGLGAESLAIVPLVMFISSFSTSLIVKSMNKHLGRKVAQIRINFALNFGVCWFGVINFLTFSSLTLLAVFLEQQDAHGYGLEQGESTPHMKSMLSLYCLVCVSFHLGHFLNIFEP